MRAIDPNSTGYVERDGVRTYYEVYGSGEPTLLLLPAWSIVHSRIWKAQIPYLARHFRVIAFDGRGNGKSDRPRGPEAYLARHFLDDAVAVLDATDTRSAVIAGFSFGGHIGAMLAALHPERARGAVLIAPAARFGPGNAHIKPEAFLKARNAAEGWAKYNRHYWRENYPDFVQFFFEQVFCEPHSSKQIEDSVGWGLETTPDVLADTVIARFAAADEGESVYRKIRCPVLVIHGDDDRIVPYAKGKLVAEVTGGRLVTLEGVGHAPLVRYPAQVNLLIRDFIAGLRPPKQPAPAARRRGPRRRKRALYLSSPIGLGHGRRDLAIARELRGLHPHLEVDWLAQHPVTALLQAAGERIHPASRLLANESRHIESEAGEHDLHVFQALRRMDEILVANFMVFQEIVEDGGYDLVVADEAWDVDHFWHEHPELKRSALAWFTDFVGYLPMPEGGDREILLTADYNAEMIEHVEGRPRLRDRAIFVGHPDDVVTGTFGPGLPGIRSWTEEHFDFCGYITGFDPTGLGGRTALRRRLGYASDETVCIVAVGGSAVGAHLLRRVIQAYPAARRRLPDLRMVAVAGPRIDPATLPRHEGVEIHGYVPDLHRHLAACDLALVQGGLTTCMELAAARTPFIYFPLHNHFEQNFHVRHRLERYGAGRPMDYAAWRCVETDGARRAARMLADLL